MVGQVCTLLLRHVWSGLYSTSLSYLIRCVLYSSIMIGQVFSTPPSSLVRCVLYSLVIIGQACTLLFRRDWSGYSSAMIGQLYSLILGHGWSGVFSTSPSCLVRSVLYFSIMIGQVCTLLLPL